MSKRASPVRIFTLGHSNRSGRDFLKILKSYKLKLVVDVRTVPKSLCNPQFGKARLQKSLNRHGIEYVHMPGLGGFRHAKKDSPNTGWRNQSFRGFADYMRTDEFEENLNKLISRSKRKRLVLVCAEALPWRCHRSLIADALSMKGLAVEDIFTPASHRPHKPTSFLKVRKGRPIYPK